MYVIDDFSTKQVVRANMRTNFAPNGSAEWIAEDGSGETLSLSGQSYLLRESGGGLIEFTLPGSSPCDWNTGACYSAKFATRITDPTGLTTSISFGTSGVCALDELGTCVQWETIVRPEVIKRSDGFEIRLYYELQSQHYYYNGDWETIARIEAVDRSLILCPAYPQSCPSPTTKTVTYGWTGGYPLSSLQVTDAAGTTVYTYDGRGRLIGKRQPGFAADNVTYFYNQSNQVSSVVNRGVLSSYSFANAISAQEFITTRTSNGYSETFVFGLGSKKLKRVIRPGNLVQSYTYNAMGRLARTTWPEGNYVEHAYDPRGNVVQTVEAVLSRMWLELARQRSPAG